MNCNRCLILKLILIQALLALSISSVAEGLTVKGAIIEMNVTPGDHISREIKVQTSNSDSPMDILIDVMGYGQSLQGGSKEILPEKDTSPYTARPFLNATPASIHIDPGQQKSVTLAGEVPVDVGSGGRYAIVNIHSKPQGNGTVGVSLAINVPVRLTISGTEQIRKGEITDIKLKEPISGRQQNVTLSFKNTGNYHYFVKVDASLTDKDGVLQATASAPLSFSSVIPTSTRAIEFSFRPVAALNAGAYKVNATVKLEDGTVLAEKVIGFTL
jgi:P pilus assembly chaperone PapD